MGSIQNTVHYCSVSKGNRILYAYSGGDHEIENMASLCLERTPSFHAWYFQTIRKRTFGFLMEDGYVYFTIVDEGLGSMGVLQFLQHVSDEFKKVSKNNSKGSFSGLNSICLQEQLLPIIRSLISSLENVAPSSDPSPSPESNSNLQMEGATSTKAPLLGKPNKQEKKKKKKMKDLVIEIRDNISEEQRKSTDRGMKIDASNTESTNQGMGVSAISLQKGSNSMRIRASPQSARRMWFHHVRVILAIDVIVCLILFGIWLGICHGFQCISD